ncbi:MAG: hypothetical protein WA746_13215, partial [Isosphaeraceae bacterium]
STVPRSSLQIVVTECADQQLRFVEKIIGVGSVLVVSSTAPSVLRALMAAGTPEISTFSYRTPVQYR